MKRQRLNYRFHDPNPTEETADYILKIFIEANKKKVQEAIEAVTKALPDTAQKAEEAPA